MASSKQLADLLSEVPLFSTCSQKQRRQIADQATFAEFASGTVLVAEGEEGHGLFVLLSGTVEVDRDGSIVDTMSAGAHFGELALIDGLTRTATITAVDPVSVAVLRRQQLHDLIRKSPDIAEQLLIALATELRSARSTSG